MYPFHFCTKPQKQKTYSEAMEAEPVRRLHRHHVVGSVRLGIDGWLRPYQRMGEDVTAQIQRWGELRLILREMQAANRCDLGYPTGAERTHPAG
jgi:hypothetical protein